MGACFLSTVCSGLAVSRSPESSLLTAFQGGPVSSPGTGLDFQLLSISSAWLLLELAIESPQASLVLTKRLERPVHLFPDGESGLLLPPDTTRPSAACYTFHHDVHRVTRTLPPFIFCTSSYPGQQLPQGWRALSWALGISGLTLMISCAPATWCDQNENR